MEVFMRHSLITLAALAASGLKLPDPGPGEKPPELPVALNNEQLSEAVAQVATELEKIAAEAPYAADPREPAKRIAMVLAAYFRTPD